MKKKNDMAANFVSGGMHIQARTNADRAKSRNTGLAVAQFSDAIPNRQPAKHWKIENVRVVTWAEKQAGNSQYHIGLLFECWPDGLWGKPEIALWHYRTQKWADHADEIRDNLARNYVYSEMVSQVIKSCRELTRVIRELPFAPLPHWQTPMPVPMKRRARLSGCGCGPASTALFIS